MNGEDRGEKGGGMPPLFTGALQLAVTGDVTSSSTCTLHQ